MARFKGFLRSIGGTAALVLILTGCTAKDADEADEWGQEAVEYFDQLTVELDENDFYAVLDFYTASARIEKWRGDLRGGARVSELLRWDIGSLKREVQGVYLASVSAVTLVRWLGADPLSGAVVNSVDDGRISHETVFDLASTMERSLRAPLRVITQYEDLYMAYAKA